MLGGIVEINDSLQRIELVSHFNYSLQLFDANYEELISLIDFMCEEKNGLHLFAIINHWKLSELQVHLGFKLHNFVCAAKSLVDHSRVLYKRFYTKQGIEFPEYISEVKSRFDNNTLSKFIEFLRTYSQHEKLPTIGSTFTFDSSNDDGFIFKITLNSNELLKSSSIGALAKDYINTQGDKIIIKNVITEYHKQIHSFYKWFNSKQSIHLKSDFDVVDRYTNSLYLQNFRNFISTFEIKNDISSIKEYFISLLSANDYKLLDVYSEDLNTWLNKAFSLIESNSSESIPDDIKNAIQSQC